MPGGDSVPEYLQLVTECDAGRANLNLAIEKFNQKIKGGHIPQATADDWNTFISYAITNINNIQAHGLAMALIIEGA